MTDPTRSVDELAAIAVELVGRIRDDDPEANKRWLTAALPDPGDWFRLAFVVAAAVPDDRSWKALTAWTRLRQEAGEDDPDLVDEGPVLRPAPSATRKPAAEVRPCGTTAAYRRHKYYGEMPCEACRTAERNRDRKRKQTERRAA